MSILSFGWIESERHRRLAYAGLAALPVLYSLAFLALGAGYVLDDWFFQRNARFDGFFAVAGEHGMQRSTAVPSGGSYSARGPATPCPASCSWLQPIRPSPSAWCCSSGA